MVAIALRAELIMEVERLVRELGRVVMPSEGLIGLATPSKVIEPSAALLVAMAPIALAAVELATRLVAA